MRIDKPNHAPNPLHAIRLLRRSRWFAATLAFGFAATLQTLRAQVVVLDDDFNNVSNNIAVNTNGIGNGFTTFTGGSGVATETNSLIGLKSTVNGGDRSVICSMDAIPIGASGTVFNFTNIAFAPTTTNTPNTDRLYLGVGDRSPAGDWSENGKTNMPNGFWIQPNSDSIVTGTGAGGWGDNISCLFYKDPGGKLTELANWKFDTLKWGPNVTANFNPVLNIQLTLTLTNWALVITGDTSTNLAINYSGTYAAANITNALLNGYSPPHVGAEDQTEGPCMQMTIDRVRAAQSGSLIVPTPTFVTPQFAFATNFVNAGEPLNAYSMVQSTIGTPVLRWQLQDLSVSGAFTNLPSGTTTNVAINTTALGDLNPRGVRLIATAGGISVTSAVVTLTVGAPVPGVPCNIYMASPLQTIDGYGFSCAWSSISTPKAYSLYQTLGCSILRAQTDNNQSGQASLVQSAHKSGVLCFGTQWSIPSQWTYSTTNNGTISTFITNGAAYASWLNSVALNYGLDYVSPQNEPEGQNMPYSTMYDFVISNTAAFTVPLIMPESWGFNDNYSDTAINSPVGVTNFAILGGHLYAGGLYNHANAIAHGKHVWQTEYYVDGPTNIGPTLNYAKLVSDCMNYRMSAYVQWWVADYDPATLIVDSSGNIFKMGYALGQFAKFVRPGALHVTADYNPASKVFVTAYNVNGGAVIVALNTNAVPEEIQFNVWNGDASSFEGYQTSSTLGMADIGSFAVSNASFTVNLPAQSITTYVQSGIVGVTNSTITWSAPVPISPSADATLTPPPGQTLVGAALFGGTYQGTAYTVTLTNGLHINFTSGGQIATVTGNGTGTGSYTGTTTNANFASVLNQFSYDGGPKTITLNYLTPGTRYIVQFFGLDDRAGGASTRQAYLQDAANTNFYSAKWQMNANVYVEGSFIATSPTKTFIEQLPGNTSGGDVGNGNANALVLWAAATTPASQPFPAIGATNVPTSPAFSWTPGANAVTYAIYMGTTSNAVAQATAWSPTVDNFTANTMTNTGPESFSAPQFAGTVTATNFNPTLSASTTYYWRVDAINGNNTNKGTVWSFTTAPPVTTPVGQWLTGAQNYQDVSGFSPAGTHDAYKITGTAGWSTNVPPGFTGYSLSLTNSGLAVSNSSTLDAGYTNTFDNLITNGFTVTCWAYGFPGAWNPWVSKYGDSGTSPTSGWQLRSDGYATASNVPCWTVRNGGVGTVTLGSDPFNNPDDMASGFAVPGASAWHFYSGTFNPVTGIRSLYVDGTLAAQETGNAPMILSAPEHLCIGAKDSPPGNSFGNYFTGLIYDVRIYSYAMTSNQVLSVQKIATTITTPPTASPITYGQSLASSTLSGGQASVAGTFAFTTPSLVPLAGTNSQSVTFTPSNTTTNTTVTFGVSVVVNRATPAITTAPTASAIVYGQTLANSTLSGGGGSVLGTFAFTTPSTAPPLGTSSQSVTFTPSDPNDYSTVTLNVNVTVSQATPTITAPPTATGIIYGQTLANSTLNGGTASVPGGFAFTTPSLAPNAGTAAQSVTFTPANTTDYTLVLTNVSVTVTQAPSTITTIPTASALTYGQTLASSVLSGGVASPSGSFGFLLPTKVPTAGTANQFVVFTPTDTNNYKTRIVAVSVTVNQATPVVTWTNPAAITYGVAVGTNQLTAGASVAGNFTYTPSSGTVLNAGTNGLTAVFLPSDALDYTGATNMTSLVVQPAALTVTADNASRLYGQANPSFTGIIVGVTNGDNISATYSCSADLTSPGGLYAIVPALVDPDGRLVNYLVTTNNGMLTVTGPPGILMQPVSQAVALGGSITLWVSATTSTSVTNYQWQFSAGTNPVSFNNLANSGNISGAMSNVLAITGFQGTNAGLYQVTVSDGTSGAASSNALVTVAVQPMISNSASLSGTMLSLQFPTELGPNYVIESTLDLMNPDWQTVTNFVGDGTIKTVPVSVAASQGAYYRILVQ